MDGDAVCACKILQNLFKSDNTQYTLVPVAGKGELQQAFLDHMGQVKVVVLINCGGSLNILEHFEPDDDIEFFIIDRLYLLTIFIFKFIVTLVTDL
jgi:cell division control protein 45